MGRTPQQGLGAKEGDDDVPGSVRSEGLLLADEGSAAVGDTDLLFT